jgi:hypothetical protein
MHARGIDGVLSALALDRPASFMIDMLDRDALKVPVEERMHNARIGKARDSELRDIAQRLLVTE